MFCNWFLLSSRHNLPSYQTSLSIMSRTGTSYPQFLERTQVLKEGVFKFPILGTITVQIIGDRDRTWISVCDIFISVWGFPGKNHGQLGDISLGYGACFSVVSLFIWGKKGAVTLHMSLFTSSKTLELLGGYDTDLSRIQKTKPLLISHL